MNIVELHQERALGVTLTELLEAIYSRNALRAAHHLPRLDVPTELTKAVNELVHVKCAEFARTHNLRRRCYEKFYIRQRRLHGPDFRLNGWISHMGLAGVTSMRIWRLFRRMHWRELEMLERWARNPRVATGEKSFFGLLQEHVKI